MKALARTLGLLCAGFAMFVAGGCEDERGIQGAAPRVERFYVGPTGTAPDSADYESTPGDGVLTIDFGQVDVDTTSNRYLFLQNTGRSDLKLSNAEFADGSSSDFALMCSNGADFAACPVASGTVLEVSPGSSLIVRVSYSPRDLGTDAGTFYLDVNAADHNRVTVNLNGEGVTPEIQVCVNDCTGDQDGPGCSGAPEVCNDEVQPADLELQFGDADMDTSLRRRLVIHNQGDRDLQITKLQFSGDFNQFFLDKNNHDLPGVLSAGQTATIFVLYDPGTGGNHTSILQIVSNDVNEREINVVLRGRGMAPRACPDPLLLDFGNVATGEPKVMSFSLKNCGLLDLNVMNVAMNTDSSGDFSLINPPGLPADLAPDASVEIQVQYLPMAQGSDHGGVDIFSDDPASDPATHLTGTVSLLGTSIPRACDIQATPFAVNFGGVVLNTPETIDLIVSNQGSDTCILNDAQITVNSAANEFSILQAPSPNTSFEPGETLVVRLQYQPAGLGHDTGTLSLFGNDKDTNEVRVDLNAEGVEASACNLEVSPTSLTFGTVKMNNTQAMTVQLTNTGQELCHISNYVLKPSSMFPSDFSITSAPPVPITLNRRGQPNSQAQIEITFAPEALDRHSGALWIYSDDPDLQLVGGSGFDTMLCTFPQGPQLGEACIPVSGYSAESEIEVVPAELDFGVVTVGCNSPELHITVYNLGTEPLNVTDIYLEDPADPNFEIMYAPSLPYTLQGGGSFEVRLRYHPQDTNAHRSNLYIQSDASNVETLAVPLYGRGTNISDQTDVFYQPDKVKSDVLFVVDNSGSMGEEQNALATNFDVFIQHAITLDVDYHIGVIATEVNDPETNVGNPGRPIYPGILVQAPGRPKIITNTTPNVEAAFADNVRLGTCCSDEQEAGLEAAWMALSPPNVDDPTMNGGFVREDAKLYIICVSDEQDQSKGDPDFYVDFFSSIKGYRNTDLMKVSAIVGDTPGGCTGGSGTADDGSRYIEVTNRTGGVFESICTSNWAQALQTLGLDAFAAIREFPLSRPADPNTITVRVNGIVVSRASSQGGANGWSYYGDTNSVFFGDNVVPGKGDMIEVSYTAACL